MQVAVILVLDIGMVDVELEIAVPSKNRQYILRILKWQVDHHFVCIPRHCQRFSMKVHDWRQYRETEMVPVQTDTNVCRRERLHERLHDRVPDAHRNRMIERILMADADDRDASFTRSMGNH